ncbi:ATP synthase F0 subunit 8 (mitochondrion) [Falco peregrinus]|uniref:ATP synthase complex subunit 8 n=1 Tax=Falco peregrinus TaxID=8954 RepID=Q9XL06_FALPE|nr:ATP synthase F0 subunit 8 [Falco peregrinus]AAD32496.1 ATPase 8 [Falco peregrinus]AEZ50976.1 ATP synthase F0 subunit 8 [Falco peregrinus]AFL03150.1 ATP synthase F0 subunit 8 [Falco peregrinus]
MPQLNPNPWFLTMLATWAIFLLIIQPKLLPFTPTNPPMNKTNTSNKSTPWTWPWT